MGIEKLNTNRGSLSQVLEEQEQNYVDEVGDPSSDKRDGLGDQTILFLPSISPRNPPDFLIGKLLQVVEEDGRILDLVHRLIRDSSDPRLQVATSVSPCR